MAMELDGEYLIKAPREAVWAALNDIDNLQRCIPGCEDMSAISDDEYECVVVAKIGPLKARFKSTIQLSEVNPPESYTLSGKGIGGAAGFGQGSADVHLTTINDATELKYNASVKTGGKLAQIGARMLTSTSRKLVGEFFSRFEAGFDAEAGAE